MGKHHETQALPFTEPPMHIAEWGMRLRESLLGEAAVYSVEYFEAESRKRTDKKVPENIVQIQIYDDTLFDNGVIHKITESIAAAHNGRYAKNKKPLRFWRSGS